MIFSRKEPSFSGQVAVITGCASGVGRHLVGACLRRGMRVLAADVDDLRLLEAVGQEGWPTASVVVRAMDVRHADSWSDAATLAQERFGHIDVLFNVAGYLKPGYLLETPAHEIDRHIDINVKGVLLGCQIIGNVMLKQGYGHIVNVASLAGLAPVPGIGLYSTSKFAVRAASLILAEELRDKGIAVTALCPDAIETPMLRLQEDYEEAALTFSGHKPLTLSDIEATLFGHVLPDRPVEVFLPFDRGVIAKFSNAFPQVSRYASSLMTWQGKRAQQKRRHLSH